MSQHLFKTFLFLFFITGCVGISPSSPQTNKEELTTLLRALDTKITHKEATQLSEAIFEETARLRKMFQRTTSPLWHNVLVNTGIREKGLCYHWSDALYLALKKKPYNYFDFHLLVADRGEYFFEHNVLVVSVKGGRAEEGIIIDPWRQRGSLYVSKVKEDVYYHWIHRKERCCSP